VNIHSVQFSSSVLSDSLQPHESQHQTSLAITNSRSSLRLTSIESVMPSSHLIFCCPLLLVSPIPPSMRVFSNESTLRMRWRKYRSFSFSIIPSKEIPGLISFRKDWLDLLAVQGTLKSLLQHHSSKASILQRSAFFTVQLSHPYMTTGKTIALTRWTFVGKVMSLLLNMLSRLVLIFLQRSLVFPILFFSCISLRCSLRNPFLFLLAILWNSAFRCLYLSFSSLPFASLLFSTICKASSDYHFAFLHFFFLGMVLITASYTMSRTSVHKFKNRNAGLEEAQAGIKIARRNI